MARDKEIDVESVLLYEDIASAPKRQDALKPCILPTTDQVLFWLADEGLIKGPGQRRQNHPPSR
jgi:hypothetical protein